MIKHALAIVYKDIQIEAGRLRLFTSLISLSFILIFLSSLVSAKFPQTKPEMVALTIWFILIYLLFQTLSRSLATEDESGCWDALLLCPISAKAIFLGKFIYNCFLVIVVELITFPFYLLFFNLSVNTVLILVPIIIAILGLVAVGLLVSLFSLRNQGRELLSNVISLPLFLPALFLGLSITIDLSKGMGLEGVAKQILLLVIYDIVFMIISFIAFDTNHIE